MEWKDIAGTVAQYAPIAGAAIGGPAGAAAGTAIKLIAGLFGIKSPEPKPEEIDAAIKADPEMALKLKQLDYQFTMEMRKQDVEEFKAALADVSSARDRQIKHEEMTKSTDYNLYILAWIVIVGFFASIYVLTMHALPEDTVNVVFMLLGTLAAGFGSVMQYFFGSTRTSKDKTDALSGSIPIDRLDQIMTAANGKKK